MEEEFFFAIASHDIGAEHQWCTLEFSLLLTMILFPKWKKEGWRGQADRILKRDGQMLGTFENKRIAKSLIKNEIKKSKAKLENELAEINIKQSRISPLWLIPTILVTAGVTTIACWVLALRKRNRIRKP